MWLKDRADSAARGWNCLKSHTFRVLATVCILGCSLDCGPEHHTSHSVWLITPSQHSSWSLRRTVPRDCPKAQEVGAAHFILFFFLTLHAPPKQFFPPSHLLSWVRHKSHGQKFSVHLSMKFQTMGQVYTGLVLLNSAYSPERTASPLFLPSRSLTTFFIVAYHKSSLLCWSKQK